MAIRKIKAGLVTQTILSRFVGEDGQIFYDPRSGELRISDGTTPGGFPISPYKRTLTIPSWPPAYLAPNTIYKVFNQTTNVVEAWETDGNGNAFKQSDASISDVIDVTKIFVNSSGLPIEPYQP